MTVNIPKRLPSMAADKVVYILGAMGEMMLHLEMEFDHRLDVKRLTRAFDLVLDAEPVLGCKLIVGKFRTYWQRLDNSQRDNFMIVSSGNGYENFRAKPHDAHGGPQVSGCLWQDDASGKDRLILKISHEAADAGGCKEVSGALAGIYNALAESPDYLPEPNLKGSRSSWQVLRLVPKTAYPRIYVNYLRTQWKLLTSSKGFGFSREGEYGGRPEYVVRHIPADRVARIADCGRKMKATLNDMLMASFFRAAADLGDWDHKSRLQALMTADLRLHYLPSGRGEGICNLSALEFAFPGSDLGHSFSDSVKRISHLIGLRKKNWLGLSDYIGVMPTISLMPAKLAKNIFGGLLLFSMKRIGLVNALTNMGPIKAEDVTYDQPAARAWVTVPPMNPPLFGMGMTGYAGSLTLSIGTYQPVYTAGIVNQFYDRMLEQLPD
jgi:NRPS condensation-like uncharacterized protein